mgnify:CR=1 FL=1
MLKEIRDRKSAAERERGIAAAIDACDQHRATQDWENARTVRDQISDELWECINGLRLFLESPEAAEMHKSQTAAFYEKVLLASYQFQGIAASTTPRDEKLRMLRSPVGPGSSAWWPNSVVAA